ncbi:MAG: nucleoside deaminase [Gemmatimonadota bacterium]
MSQTSDQNLPGIRFMAEAIRIATANVADGGGPFGAVVVREGRIIARGVNRVTNDHDPTAHAEVQAIRAACRQLGSFQLDGCEIYCSTEPCPMCLGAIYWARPDRVWYAATKADAAAAGFDDDFIYQELDRPREERHLPMRQLASDDVMEPFRAWADSVDRIEY